MLSKLSNKIAKTYYYIDTVLENDDFSSSIEYSEDEFSLVAAVQLYVGFFVMLLSSCSNITQEHFDILKTIAPTNFNTVDELREFIQKSLEVIQKNCDDYDPDNSFFKYAVEVDNFVDLTDEGETIKISSSVFDVLCDIGVLCVSISYEDDVIKTFESITNKIKQYLKEYNIDVIAPNISKPIVDNCKSENHLFLDLNHNNLAELTQAINTIGKFLIHDFESINVLKLLKSIDNDAFEPIYLEVESIVRQKFNSTFDTTIGFDEINSTFLRKYFDELVAEYDSLKYQWDKIYDYKIENDSVILINYKGIGTKATVPNKIKGYPVKKIATECFHGKFNLSVVEILAQITEIPKNCFFCCFNLKEVKLPDTIEIIAEGAFQSCEKLEKVNLPYSLQHIGYWSFNKCTKLKELYLSPNISNIDYVGGMQTFSKKTLFRCEKDSYAESYLKKYKYVYEIIEK